MSSEGRAGALSVVGSLVPVLAGLVASAMLLVDYLRPAPVFCSEGGGCDALKHSLYATPMGIPMPLFGVVGFLALGVSALVKGERARMAQGALAAIAGLVGLTLLFLQAKLGHLCVFCCVADASGVVSFLVALARLRFAPAAGVSLGPSLAGASTMVVALGAPLVGGFKADTTPQAIRDEIAQTPAGKVTVVDFVDYECPFCRMTHAEFEPLLEQHKGQLRVVRRQVPLKMHPHAMDAARAACCGEKMGQGEAMANALFTAPEDDLTVEGCEKIAARLGLGLDGFRACVHDPATDAIIAADKAEFQAAGGYALPTIWIGDRQIIGSQPKEELEKALDAAMRGAGS
jgi:protein-disulfide isomerase